MTKAWNSSGIDLSQVSRHLDAGVSRGLELAAAEVLVESDRNVPYLTERLLKSGDSGLVDDKTAAVTYTDPKAVAVHEDLTSKRRHGRTAKFLENAFNANRQRILELIAREARRELD